MSLPISALRMPILALVACVALTIAACQPTTPVSSTPVSSTPVSSTPEPATSAPTTETPNHPNTESLAWSPAEPRMKTRWFDEVGPENALPEYPRPQMVREEWLNLNGLWEWRSASEGQEPPFGTTLPREILVPFPVESALSGIGAEHVERVWYRRTFTVPDAWAGQRVLLNFGAVDWESTVWVNEQEMGTHRGGYDAFTYDITDALQTGENEIIVGVYDPNDGGFQPVGKQRLEPGGIWYTGSSGIWQTVWLEPVPALAIESLRMTPDLENNLLHLETAYTGDGADATVEAVAFADGEEVARITAAAGEAIALPIADPRLWSPDDPFLYDLTVSLKQGDEVIDSVDSYFGMRSIALARLGTATRIMLNDEFVFQYGLLDQGFWPDGLYTAPTDEALRYDIETAKELGYNLLRKHVKVEPARWYYWADVLGMLVWQDMPNIPEYKPVSDEAKANFEIELEQLIAERHNSPSIIMWVVFNEAWGQHDTIRYVNLVRDWDDSRLINNASGWNDMSAGDVIDKHEYVGPAIPLPSTGRASVLGEFGGLGLAIEGHKWDPTRTYDYEGQANIDALTERYLGLVEQLKPLMDRGKLNAAIYTQVSDVETEVNGIMTYDREVIKMDAETLRAAHAGLIEAGEVINSQ